MATACHPPAPHQHYDDPVSVNAPNGSAHLGPYPRGLPIQDIDYHDPRYPTSLSAAKQAVDRRASAIPAFQSAPAPAPWDDNADYDEGAMSMAPRSVSDPPPQVRGWASSNSPSHSRSSKQSSKERQTFADAAQAMEDVQEDNGEPSPQPTKSETAVSFGLPPGAAPASPPVAERYSLVNGDLRESPPSRGVEYPDVPHSKPQAEYMPEEETAMPPPRDLSQSHPASLLPSIPRHPSLPHAGVGAGPSNASGYTPIVPLSASPSYDPARVPISPAPRASAQFPTYITPTASAPKPVTPVYSPKPPAPPEEICVECAMRDQDMADVDVTSPGVWDRESDVYFEDLKRREAEEEETGIFDTQGSRPRSKGGRLTEQNIKVWLTMNPREPTSRQHTLDNYVKSQRRLIEAEALAHARAMQEARQLDSRMRDTYSQLRRSAYDTGNSPSPIDDLGGVRIKTPRSPSGTPSAPFSPHTRSHSRDVTLLENGMIVEHVDVRREERERRREERRERSRARKSSRSSGMDVTSLYSTHSLLPHADSGLGLKSGTRYSQSSSARPTSVLTAPMEGQPGLPRAISQASFSDVHSLGSASPRRSRFFGFKNLSQGFRSQDSLAQSGMSGSMVDMHVALQREAYLHSKYGPPLNHEATLPQHQQPWPPSQPVMEKKPEEKAPKKKKGLAKVWRIITGGSSSAKGESQMTRGQQRRSVERTTEDDMPLAPPPPLSYLVNNRGSRNPDHGGVARHAAQSTPSLSSMGSPGPGRHPMPPSPALSPPTAPSSLLPSPTSSRPPGAVDRDMVIHDHKMNGYPDDTRPPTEEGVRVPPNQRSLSSVISEPDMRQKMQQPPVSAMPALAPPGQLKQPRPMSTFIGSDKSLPPLPGDDDSQMRPPMVQSDSRPQTMFTYDPKQISLQQGMRPELRPPIAPFRSADNRRQSFGGMTARPQFGSAPVNGAFRPEQMGGPRYDDFGASRRSLGRFQENRFLTSPSPNTGKRKSKFGLASLFGRKSQMYDDGATLEGSRDMDSVSRATSRLSDAPMSVSTSVNGTPRTVRPPSTSRKIVENLVEQDPEFVAYRYPSNDQHFDLLK